MCKLRASGLHLRISYNSFCISLKHMDLDTCVGNMLAYIIYACTAAYIDICSVEKFENFFV